MSAQIYYIGGASASGKSTVAKEVSQEHGLPMTKLDDINNLLQKAGVEESERWKASREVSFKFVSVLIKSIKSGTQCLVEGVYILPDEAAELMKGGNFYPVYCGYPDAVAQDRFEQIKENSTGNREHWLLFKSDDEALAFLQREIENSIKYRDECKRWQIEFFDFTIFEDGASQLKTYLKSSLMRSASGQKQPS